MGKVIIIQHCQSEHHINDLTGGWTDTPLTKLGQGQANRIGIRLNNEIDSSEYTLYSSDLMRTKETAKIIANHLNLNIIEEKGLREINNGIAIGMTKAWAKENGNLRTKDGFDIDYLAFPKGETVRMFYKRTHECMEKIYAAKKENIIIVTHGGTVSNILAWWLKLRPEILNEACFLASPGSISILTKSRYGQNALRAFNDTLHLEGLPTK